MKNIAVILAGGSGIRLKSSVPKQFMSLNGKQVYQYVVDALYDSKLFDEIIMVLNPKYADLVKNNEKISYLIKGGATRTESVANALEYYKINQYQNIFFHDAARPFLKVEDIKQYILALKTYQAAITAVPITDALFHANREKYKLIQTPEAFKLSYLLHKFNKEANFTAIYEHIYPAKIKFIELPHQNLKITHPSDFYLAEQLMKYQEVTKRESVVNHKNILILGGTGGIGKALKSKLTDLGATVNALGSKDIDLSKNFKLSVVNHKWDCIIHSAGAYATDKEGLIKNYDPIMNVNFRSIVWLVENAQDLLNPGGSIICIGSTAAAKGRPGISLYSASKAALNCFVEGIYPALLEKNIRINVICPAKVATKLQKKINPKANLDDMIQPDEIAKIIMGYIDIDKSGEIVYVRVGEA